MNNPIPNARLQICNQHNQPIKYYDKNGKNPQCKACLIQKGELITFEQIQQQYQEIIINNNKENEFQLQYLQMFKDGILRYKENIITILNKAIQQIIDQMNSIQSQQKSMQQLDNIMNKYTSIKDFTTYLNNNQKSNKRFSSQILMNLLVDLKSNIMKIDFLYAIQEKIVEKQKSLQKMEYELIQQVEGRAMFISCFAFDEKNNNLIVGVECYIVIFDFENGKIGCEICSQKIHYRRVDCLYCMKNTHDFVSGSEDGVIKIWSLDKFYKWQAYQDLKAHNGMISCIKLNSIEDLLISGSLDGIVNFWRKLQNSWNSSHSINLEVSIYDLSLNENEDKLIVCGNSIFITVMTIQSNQEWKIVQKIKVEECGYRLCFTVEDQFVYQSETLDYLQVYDYDQTKQQFYTKSKVKVQSVKDCIKLFPCQYIKNLNILTVKHGKFVNIFKVNQNGQYTLIQTVYYEHGYQYGKMTDDGEYLVTWDCGSREIQVRKLKYKEEFF